jgi:hypothetical protein
MGLVMVMPWKAEKRGSKWVVVTEGSGRVVGTHPSREKAMAQVRALYANASESEKKMAKGKKK